MKKSIMKRATFCALLSTSMLLAQQTFAQKDKEDKVFSGGFGIEGGAVVGNAGFKETFSAEFGLSGRFAYKVGPGWVTLTPGYTLVLPKTIDEEDISVGAHLFVKGGYKFIFLDKLFVQGEVGYGSYTIYTDTGDGDLLKSSSGGVCFAPTIGGNFGVFEVGLKYEYTKLSGGAVSTAGIRLGFNF